MRRKRVVTFLNVREVLKGMDMLGTVGITLALQINSRQRENLKIFFAERKEDQTD